MKFTQTRARGLVVAATLFLGLVAAAAPLRAELITGSDFVEGYRYTARYDGYGPYAWNYSYTMSFDTTSATAGTVTAGVQVNFRFVDDNVPADRDAWKSTVEFDIEDKWNDEHTFVLEGVTIASVVDVMFDGPTFDQTVDVLPGSGATNLLTWYTSQGPMTTAHEFGHMLGLYDEYQGGALNPEGFIDQGSLMGSVSSTAMPDRYYEPFVEFVEGLQVAGAQVPEPATTTMLLTAILPGLLLLRRRRKQRLQQVA